MSVHQRVLRAMVLPLLLSPIAACGDDGPQTPTRVAPIPSERLGVEPASASLQLGESLQFKATGALAAAGTGIYATSWSGSDPAVVRVSPSGMVTAVGVGSAYVTASRTGVYANTRVTVSPRRQQ